MATFEQLADGYAKRLLAAENGQAEAVQIATEINGLVYSSTKEPLSAGDKGRILELIRERAPEPKTVVEGGRVRVLKEADNKNYLALVALVSGAVNG